MRKIRFDILTLFPEMFNSIMNESIIGRAVENGYVEINPVNIRDYSKDKHNRVDDYPYGGGAGMVMQPQPIYDAYKSVVGDEKVPVIYMSPQGKQFTQDIAQKLALNDRIVLLCGHYEGVDERVLEEIVTDEISIGDYVLTGGELPAMVVMDAVSRLIPGVLADDSTKEESFSDGMLEYPQYTRPIEFMGKKVPDVLVSGHHANIARWRKEESYKRTLRKRPDLLNKRGEN